VKPLGQTLLMAISLFTGVLATVGAYDCFQGWREPESAVILSVVAVWGFFYVLWSLGERGKA
jgi:high-affinity Fe2+/Pb2+ permease